ncbi:hypothetical protein L1887_03550 [Cichorium endivia]|nr:hypothetical protein L1887_03550 [Cichorium endivia]
MFTCVSRTGSQFDEKELGLACLKIGLKLKEEGEYPEKVIDYANKALKIFDENGNDSDLSLPLAMNLQLLGSACYTLNRFNECLRYLNKANRILQKLEEIIGNDGFEIKHVLHVVHLNLANTKNAMGRRKDAIIDLKKCLEIKETTLEKDSRELGVIYTGLEEHEKALEQNQLSQKVLKNWGYRDNLITDIVNLRL